MTALVTDDAGNTKSVSDTLDLDTTADADSNFAVTVASSDEVTNAAEAGDVSVTLSGVDADAVSVKVTFSDGTNSVVVDATTDASGNWVVADADLTSLTDGNITVTALVTDDAGNTKSVSDDAVKETTSPTITSDTAFTYSENQSTNATVATLKATDLSGVASYQFKWADGSLHATTQDGYFRINENGVITITQAGATSSANDFDAPNAADNTHAYAVVISDKVGNITTSTITLSETNINEAPVNTLPASVTTDEDRLVKITGMSVNDVDGNLSTVKLTVAHGTLTVDLTGGATISSGSNGSSTLTLSGTQAQINAALASLGYQGVKDYNGSDSLVIVSTDTTGATDTDTLAITVNPVNDSAVITPVVVNLTETNAVLTANGKVNITDVDSSATFVPQTNVSGSNSYGKFTLLADGTWSYSTNTAHDEFVAGQTYTDTLTVTSADGTTSTITVNILGTNDAPVAVNDAAITTPEESTVSNINVLSNDSDVDGDTLSVISASATNGTVSINSNGTLNYTPNKDYNGSDTITYTISDGHGGTSTATVSVTVTPVQDAPDAVNDSFTTNEDTTLSNINVLANDIDVDNDPLTVTAASATNGTVTINANGTLNYTPKANYSGTDVITYTISDGHGGTDTATATITVTPDADAPTISIVTQTITASTVTATTSGYIVTAYNADGTVGTIATNSNPPGFGVAGVASGANSEIGGTETLAVNFDTSLTSVNVAFAWLNSSEHILATFYKDGVAVGTYTVSGGSDGVEAVKTLSAGSGVLFDEIRFTAPYAGDDYLINSISYSNSQIYIDEDDNFTLNLNVALTDTDGSEKITSVVASGAPAGSVISDGTHTVTVSANGTADITNFDYSKLTISTPANYNGQFTLTFTATSSEMVSGNIVDSASSAITIPVTVSAVNDAPTSTNDSITVKEDTTYTLTVADFGTYSDVEGNSFNHVTISSLPTNGTLYLNGVAVTVGTHISTTDIANGKLTFVPTSNTDTDSSFNFTVSDGTLNSTSTYTTTIIVDPVADVPTVTASVSHYTANAELTDHIQLNVGNPANGSADIVSVPVNGTTYDTILLTTDTGSLRNSAMSTSEIDLTSNFTLTFNLYLGTNDAGADGITFILQNDPAGASAIGSDGEGLGAYGIKNAVAIEFDTFQNTGEVAGDHTSIYDPETGQQLTTVSQVSNLEDGQWHAVTVTWNASTYTLSYTLNGVTYSINLGANYATTYFGGSSTVNFGFTASTGAYYNSQEVQLTSFTGKLMDESGDSISTAFGSNVYALDIAAAVTDTDGSEIAKVLVTGLPAGTQLSVGKYDSSTNTWTLSTSQLSGLTFTVPTTVTTNFSFTVTAVSQETNDTTQTAQTSINMTVLVSASTVNGSSNTDYIFGSDGNDSITGGLGNDLLTGGAGADTLIGDSGDDSLYGGTGNDSIDGGSDNDYIEGGAGNDTITGGDGDDTIEGGTGNDTIVGGNGTDTIIYSNAGGAVYVDLSSSKATGADGTDSITGVENVIGSSYNDSIIGSTVANILSGGAGADTISGGGGNDTIYGGVGNDSLSGGNDDDVISGGLGDDTIDGGSGTDTVTYSTASSAVTVNLSLSSANATGGDGTDTITNVENVIGSDYADSITGSNGNNVLTGGLGNDTIDGGSGNDTIYGGAGNDSIIGGIGNDSIDGGDGTDTLSYASYSYAVTVDLSSGSSTRSTGSGSKVYTDSISSVENVIGTSYNDRITGNSGANVLTGGAGNDTINGGAGNDTIYGGTGNDSIIGGDGSDTVSYSSASASVSVNLSSGTASGGDDTDTISGVENVIGSSYNDILTGDSGANILEGGAGNDTISGGSGNDTIYGGAGNDSIIGGDGSDTVSYSSASSAVTVDLSTGTATGGDGTDTISGVENVIGSNYNDILTGDSGANILEGGAGNDTISGGAGKDTLIGGLGDDILTGGAEHDIFKWTALDVGTTTSHQTDTIKDFSIIQGDQLDLADVLNDQSGDSLDSYLTIEKSSDGKDAVITVHSNGDTATNLTVVVFGYGSDTSLQQLHDYLVNNNGVIH